MTSLAELAPGQLIDREVIVHVGDERSAARDTSTRYSRVAGRWVSERPNDSRSPDVGRNQENSGSCSMARRSGGEVVQS